MKTGTQATVSDNTTPSKQVLHVDYYSHTLARVTARLARTPSPTTVEEQPPHAPVCTKARIPKKGNKAVIANHVITPTHHKRCASTVDKKLLNLVHHTIEFSNNLQHTTNTPKQHLDCPIATVFIESYSHPTPKSKLPLNER